MSRDKVKLCDESEKEILIKQVNVKAYKRIKALYTKIEEMDVEDDMKSVKTLRGVFDFENMSMDVLETFTEGCNWENVLATEGDRIFNKYFAHIFMPQKKKTT